MPQAAKPPANAKYNPGPAWAGISTTGRSRTSGTTPATNLLPPGPCCQPCPNCGGLNCLCRPRFFAGQLLTEQDLNRLDNYIVAKNQLHNRYLVGTGVVCGLEVQCSPCANTVSVSAGYAIDTCGNDIIVCCPDTVHICKLIAACTPSTAVNCGPYKDTSSQCRDLEQEWILAISYQETPSRGVTPLTGSAQCSCGGCGSSPCSCNTGVAKSCGCGSMMPAASCCGQTVSNSNTQVSTNLPRRGAPPACEPTLTCEAYRYDIFPAPAAAAKTSLIGGEFLERILCCFKNLTANLPQLPDSTNQTQQQAETAFTAYCCNMRLALMQYVQSHGGTKCALYGKICALSCPSVGQDGYLQSADNALISFIVILIELLIDCVCLAALPPCPTPGDPRVPLACVRVRASDCTILSVCDWTPLRKNVVTNKTLGYWLGWLPFVPLIREFMEDLCCRALRIPEQLNPKRIVTGTRVADEARAKSANAKESINESGLWAPVSLSARTYDASNPILEAIAANLADGQNSITVNTLLRALTTSLDPSATAATLTATPQTQVLAEVARPLLSAFAPLARAITGRPDGNANAAPTNATPTGPAAAGAAPGSAPPSTEVAAMRSELDALKATVASQQATLDRLRKPPPTTPAHTKKPDRGG